LGGAAAAANRELIPTQPRKKSSTPKSRTHQIEQRYEEDDDESLSNHTPHRITARREMAARRKENPNPSFGRGGER
jgi:hypothetical protein